MHSWKAFACVAAAMLIAGCGQDSRQSPRAEISAKLKDNEVKMSYSRPSVKGRAIWDGLVPYGLVWRTGADEATTIEFAKDVYVSGSGGEGDSLKAGKYALFTIPEKDEWTIIFNGNPDQWGAFKYEDNKHLDALKIKAKPKQTEQLTEMLTFEFRPDGCKGEVALMWEKLEVAFDVNACPPPLSPPATATAQMGEKSVEIAYAQPAVKGREIWGKLVPYGEVWRTGANAATKVSFSHDATVGGKDVPAGEYSLFTVPQEGKWTVILNKVAEQWGAYKYDASQDLFRTEVTPMEAEMTERLTFKVVGEGDMNGKIVFMWEAKKFELPFAFKKEAM